MYLFIFKPVFASVRHPLCETLVLFLSIVRLLSWCVVCLSVLCLWHACIVTERQKRGSYGFSQKCWTIHRFVKLEGIFAELSMGWVDPRVSLGWVGLVEIFQFSANWVGLCRLCQLVYCIGIILNLPKISSRTRHTALTVMHKITVYRRKTNATTIFYSFYIVTARSVQSIVLKTRLHFKSQPALGPFFSICDRLRPVESLGWWLGLGCVGS